MLLAVSLRTSQRTRCFSSTSHSAFTPFIPTLFSEKSIVPALNRVRELDCDGALGHSTAIRLSIHEHQESSSSSPKPASAIEIVNFIGCPGLAASMIQREAHSGCSSLILADCTVAALCSCGSRCTLPGVMGACRFTTGAALQGGAGRLMPAWCLSAAPRGTRGG